MPQLASDIHAMALNRLLVNQVVDNSVEEKMQAQNYLPEKNTAKYLKAL